MQCRLQGAQHTNSGAKWQMIALYGTQNHILKESEWSLLDLTNTITIELSRHTDTIINN